MCRNFSELALYVNKMGLSYPNQYYFPSMVFLNFNENENCISKEIMHCCILHLDISLQRFL
jgi:hypothetical protein